MLVCMGVGRNFSRGEQWLTQKLFMGEVSFSGIG